MDYADSIARLLAKLRDDDRRDFDAAAAEIWNRYSEALLARVAKMLPVRIRAREDENEVANDAFKSFCLRYRDGQFRVNNRSEFWALLVQIALNKAYNVRKKHTADKRDVEAEHHRDTSQSASEHGDVLTAIASKDPSPEEAAIVRELIERLEPELQYVALKTLEGYTQKEIAASLGWSEKKVQRKLAGIRAIWRACGNE